MRRTPLLAAALVGLLASACGDDADRVTSDRVAQVRAAAAEAGLSEEVTDVLALAARGTTATFQVTFDGTDGAQVVISQEPPNRRVDVLTTGLVVESQVVRDGVAYSCELPESASPGDALTCERTTGAVLTPGAFTDEAVTAFTEELIASADAFDLSIEERTIAEHDATCLVAAPRAGTPLDGSVSSVDTICFSNEGAPLLIDSSGQRQVASGYSTEVPEGTFEV